MPTDTSASLVSAVEAATPVYEAPVAPGPEVHVLAIGVGRYPYLLDGASPVWAAYPLGLAQLTSPPLSLKAFVEFFLGYPIRAGLSAFVNPAAPVGSIWAVCSANAAVTVKTPVGNKELLPATFENIRAAFKGWLAKVSANDQNIGVFYFCGHGLSVGSQFLLAEDFGDDDDLPWRKAFDIDNTIQAVDRTVKGTIYYFLDACRQFNRNVALIRGSQPPALKAVDISKGVIGKSTTVIQATGETQLAFAEEGKTSRFTMALLTAMSGFCGVKAPGGTTWEVDGELLSSATRRLLESVNRVCHDQQVSDQAIKGARVPLLRLPKAPLVKVGIDLLPEEMRVAARIFLRKNAMDPGTIQEGKTCAFEFEIQRGFYDLGVTPLVAGKFQEYLVEEQELTPPVFDFPITVQP